MLWDYLRIPVGLGFEILLGSVLMLSATAIGWAIGRKRALFPVRAVWWWMHAVVLPLLTCRSWGQRALLIFANNSLVLAAVVAAGVRTTGAVLAVACVGIALGMALRVISELSPHWSPPSPNCPPEVRRKVRIGVAFNLLEPPAIALTVGLSLGRSSVSLAPAEVWGSFCLWVLPLLLAAACGEAFWLGAGLPPEVAADSRGGPPADGLNGASRLA